MSVLIAILAILVAALAAVLAGYLLFGPWALEWVRDFTPSIIGPG